MKRIKEDEKKKIDLLFLESKRVNDELTLKLEISKTKKSIEDAESRYREKKINDSQKERNTLEANKRMQEEKSKRQEREEESERQRRKDKIQ